MFQTSLHLHHFNPRSREGSDDKSETYPTYEGISIHAPAKGATMCVGGYLVIGRISIHAPAKGATMLTVSRICVFGFQSTLPRRERHLITGRTWEEWLSQSTLPRRERRGKLDEQFGDQDFNPRSREGSDRVFRYLSCSLQISIHAPAKGATFTAVSSCILYPISIHAPAKGATLINMDWRISSTISIHAPAKGATVPHGTNSGGKRISIHAPAKGATSSGFTFLEASKNFNPRSREGSDSGSMHSPVTN